MKHALPLKQVLTEVAQICRERVLIGHAIHNDLKVCLAPRRDASLKWWWLKLLLVVSQPTQLLVCRRRCCCLRATRGT